MSAKRLQTLSLFAFCQLNTNHATRNATRLMENFARNTHTAPKGFIPGQLLTFPTFTALNVKIQLKQTDALSLGEHLLPAAWCGAPTHHKDKQTRRRWDMKTQQ